MKNLFTNQRRAFSVEVFPPKKNSRLTAVQDTVRQLKQVNPDYVSVTYGAAGNGASSSTVQLAGFIQNEVGIETVAHLICVRFSKGEIGAILEEMERENLTNVLALRGDSPQDGKICEDFSYAKQLVEFIKEKKPGFYISAACYPETHVEAVSPEADLLHLKQKVDAGVNHLVSQLFFDNNRFFAFLENLEKYNITVPVQAGIMPLLHVKQIEKMLTLSNAVIPKSLQVLVEKYGRDPEDMRKAGLVYASRQIEQLLSQGVDGIHLYSMNNADTVKEIYNNTEGCFHKRVGERVGHKEY